MKPREDSDRGVGGGKHKPHQDNLVRNITIVVVVVIVSLIIIGLCS